MQMHEDPAAVLTRLLHAVDALDWPTVRDCFAAEVRLDYSELSGGEVEALAADDLVARWQGLLPGFDATQHLTGPCLVADDGDGVRVQTNVRGYHHIAGAEGGQVWGVHGHYVLRLAFVGRDWKITELTLRVFYQEGNTDLPALAGKRAGQSPRDTRRFD